MDKHTDELLNATETLANIFEAVDRGHFGIVGSGTSKEDKITLGIASRGHDYLSDQDKTVLVSAFTANGFDVKREKISEGEPDVESIRVLATVESLEAARAPLVETLKAQLS